MGLVREGGGAGGGGNVKPDITIEETMKDYLQNTPANTAPPLSDQEKAARAEAAAAQIQAYEDEEARKAQEAIENGGMTKDEQKAQEEQNAYLESLVQKKKAEEEAAAAAYAPVTSQSVIDAQNYLNSLINNKPAEWTGSSYDAQLKEIYDKIMSRPDFTYDLNGDALWQQYKEQYTMAGNMAMQDTMGQAVSLTGGYGSSYSQGVGEETYDSYMQELNSVIPELQKNAYDLYTDEGDALKDEYDSTAGLAKDEYNDYADKYNAWLDEANIASDAVDTAYTNQQTAKQNLINLISGTGYTPTAEELNAAGMSTGEAATWMDYYTKANTVKLEAPTTEILQGAINAYHVGGQEGLYYYIDQHPEYDGVAISAHVGEYKDYQDPTKLYNDLVALMKELNITKPVMSYEKFNSIERAKSQYGSYYNYLSSLYNEYSKYKN